MEVVATVRRGVFLELQDLRHVGQDRESSAMTVELVQHPARRLDHQLVRTAFPVAVDLVVEREDELQQCVISHGWLGFEPRFFATSAFANKARHCTFVLRYRQNIRRGSWRTR
jgi:hypothetical protein